jgi:hypothetical protein
MEDIIVNSSSVWVGVPAGGHYHCLQSTQLNLLPLLSATRFASSFCVVHDYKIYDKNGLFAAVVFLFLQGILD